MDLVQHALETTARPAPFQFRPLHVSHDAPQLVGVVHVNGERIGLSCDGPSRWRADVGSLVALYGETEVAVLGDVLALLSHTPKDDATLQ